MSQRFTGHRYTVRLVVPAMIILVLCAMSGAAFAGKPLHWEPLCEPGSGGAITSLCVSPFDHNRVLAGGDMLGIGLSEDRGEHWQATLGLSHDGEYYALAVCPSAPDNLLTCDSSHLGGTIFRSTDGGLTWKGQFRRLVFISSWPTCEARGRQET